MPVLFFCSCSLSLAWEIWTKVRQGARKGSKWDASPVVYMFTVFFLLQQESKEEHDLQKKRTKQQLDRVKFTAKRKIARRCHMSGGKGIRENEECILLKKFFFFTYVKHIC